MPLLLTVPAGASAEPPPATTGPVDGLVSLPANFKLLLEDDRWSSCNILPPGVLEAIGHHPPRVGYVLPEPRFA